VILSNLQTRLKGESYNDRTHDSTICTSLDRKTIPGFISLEIRLINHRSIEVTIRTNWPPVPGRALKSISRDENLSGVIVLLMEARGVAGDWLSSAVD